MIWIVFAPLFGAAIALVLRIDGLLAGNASGRGGTPQLVQPRFPCSAILHSIFVFDGVTLFVTVCLHAEGHGADFAWGWASVNGFAAPLGASVADDVEVELDEVFKPIFKLRLTDRCVFGCRPVVGQQPAHDRGDFRGFVGR